MTRVATGSSALATSMAASFSAARRMCARGWTGRGANSPGLHAVLEDFGHEAEPVGGVDLTPFLPSENRRRVEQHDAPHRRVQGGVEEGQTPETKVRHGIVSAHGGGGDVLGQLGLDRFDHGTEQSLLGSEMVSERAACHPGSLDDVLLPGAGEAALGEQVATRVEQSPTRCRSPFGLGPTRRSPSKNSR